MPFFVGELYEDIGVVTHLSTVRVVHRVHHWADRGHPGLRRRPAQRLDNAGSCRRRSAGVRPRPGRRPSTLSGARSWLQRALPTDDRDTVARPLTTTFIAERHLNGCASVGGCQRVAPRCRTEER
ncbi:hypothetical protein HBB16_02910 [Pseudonocardia sp. MCCB 268]|nr:hypothetical protein [Pseudonocardia cytotoxica]